MKRLSTWKQFVVWIKLNSALVAIILGLSGTLIAAVIGLSLMESYPRVQILANTPIDLFLQAISIFLWVFIILRFLHGDMSFLKSKAVKPERVNVRFEDIVGAEEAKEEAKDLVAMLTGERRLNGLGARELKGILMIGPPGCGKTFLAKAIATEAGMPFIAISGSDMTDMFVGVGASKIRNTFEQARLLAKEFGACILFIDEIDVIGKRRQFGFGGDQETNKTLNQLLVEMDGVNSKNRNSKVTVIAATNAPERALDPALLRAGRFDRKLYYDLPVREERADLLEHFLNRHAWNKDTIPLDFWAAVTSFNSPADLQNMVEEGHLIALRNGHERIEDSDLSEAHERIHLGLRRQVNVPEQRRESVAYHEAGHLVAGHYLTKDRGLFKISIVMRKTTGGVVHYFEKEEGYLKTRKEYLGHLSSALAGYAAEKMKYDNTTTGVSGDFHKALTLAHDMVYRHGMGASHRIGNFAEAEPSSLSEALKQTLNQDVQQILQEALANTEATLKQHWPLVETLVKELLEKDELELLEIKALVEAYEATQL